MKATIINQSALRLITSRSASFPDENGKAFDLIESHLNTLKGRRFYGLVYPSNEGIDYYAGLIPDCEDEERKFDELGFSIKEVAAGPCARVKLQDWMSKTELIGPTIGKMIAEYGIDPARPQIEFYRSMKELHLLVPIPH